MKVLLFNGSPRANGCTFTALTEIAKILNAEGVQTEILQSGNKPVRDCIGCGGCKGGVSDLVVGAAATIADMTDGGTFDYIYD